MDDMERLAGIVTAAIESATAPLLARIVQLERREPLQGQVGAKGEPGEKGGDGQIGPVGPQGPPGKDADLSLLMAVKGDVATLQGEWQAFKAWQSDALTKALASQPIGQGMSLEDVRPIITAEVSTAIKAMPMPEPVPGPEGKSGRDGKDGIDGKNGADGAPGLNGKDGAPGRDGKDGEVGQKGADGTSGRDGKDGASLTAEDVQPLIAAELTKAMASLPPPREPVGISGALIDRSGHLVITLTDGGSKDVGLVMGKDINPDDVARFIREEVAKIPRPQDGINGKDGFGFDSLDLVFDPVNGYQIRFTRNDEVKDFPVAIPWHAGTYESGRLYPKGAMLTDHGSLWTAQEPTRVRPPKPDEPRLRNCAWRLSAKKGRDGKDKG